MSREDEEYEEESGGSGEEDDLDEFYNTQKPEYFQKGLKDVRAAEGQNNAEGRQKNSEKDQPPKNFIPYGQFDEDKFMNEQPDQREDLQNQTVEDDSQPLDLFHYIQKIDEEHDSQDEGIQDYQTGGYHPVHIGEVIQGRYVIIQQIGWGHFSTVWLAKDFKYETYVALKIQKSAPHYLEAAYDEVEILQKVARKLKHPEWLQKAKEYHKNKKQLNRDDCHIVQLLNSFIYQGPYGNHFCFVFEILGVNLLEVIKRYNYQGVPMHLCRKIAKQVLIGLDYLHTICGVIHTDLKPENVLLCLTQQEIKDIVENGELTKNTLFADRIAFIRRSYGLEKQQERKKAEEIKETTTKKTEETQDATTSKKAENQPKNIKPTKNEGKKEDKKKDQSSGDSDNDEQEENESKNLSTTTAETNQQLTQNQKKNLKQKKQKQRRKQEELKSNHDSQNNEGNSKQNSKSSNNNSQVSQQPQKAANSEKQEERVEELFALNAGKILDKNQMMRGPELDDNFRLQIADLGNACWLWHHFATEIQTRQYRSPEVILQASYNDTADVWSLACMLFEMLTGDFLFEPRRGPTFSKNDDHLAQICELTRRFPKDFAFRGEKSKRFFDEHGNMRKIPNLQYWSLENVLTDKYKIKQEEAKEFAAFLMPMLNCYPQKRATAAHCLKSRWLEMPSNVNYKMNDDEYRDWIRLKQEKEEVEGQPEPLNFMDIDDNDADNQDNSDFDVRDIADDRFRKTNLRFIQRQYIDRSFTDLGYIGYGDGIDIEKLDFTGNWQFTEFQNNSQKSSHQSHVHTNHHKQK